MQSIYEKKKTDYSSRSSFPLFINCDTSPLNTAHSECLRKKSGGQSYHHVDSITNLKMNIGLLKVYTKSKSSFNFDFTLSGPQLKAYKPTTRGQYGTAADLEETAFCMKGWSSEDLLLHRRQSSLAASRAAQLLNH